MLAAEANPNGNTPNPEAVQEVLSGIRIEANAAWWGFNPEDVTESLQAAIDSGAARLVIPYMGQDWVVRPLQLRSNLALSFEPGVVLMAKKDAFKGKGDSLITATDCVNIALRGYGATLRMRHLDYRSEAYEKAEWRMTLDISGCTGVTVEGLRLESSGGDGIYVGCTGKQPYCKDVVIRDVVCHDHHRQGISVIGAENLLIENCTLSNTGGTAPEAGIDFEPNGPEERLVNCVVRNCTMANNQGAGVLVYLKPLTKESLPVSLTVENCLMIGPNDVGIGVGAISDNGPGGLIEFRNCVIEGPAGAGAYVYDKSPGAALVRFVNCHWARTSTVPGGRSDTPRVPLHLHRRRASLAKQIGGIEFIDCHVYDTEDRPVLMVECEAPDGAGLNGLKGQITVHSPYPPRAELGSNPTGELQLIAYPR
jgi:hypothetical protein